MEGVSMVFNRFEAFSNACIVAQLAMINGCGFSQEVSVSSWDVTVSVYYHADKCSLEKDEVLFRSVILVGARFDSCKRESEGLAVFRARYDLV